MGRGLFLLLLGFLILPLSAAAQPVRAEHWAAQETLHLVDMTLTTQGNPWAPMSRGQWVDLLVRAWGVSGSSGAGFSDLKTDDPYYEALLTAQGAGWVKGYPDGTVHPEEPIQRAEMAALLFRLTKENLPDQVGEKGFFDLGPAHWFYLEARQASRKGLIAGDGQGCFQPDAQADWGTGAALLRRAMQKAQEGDLPKDDTLEGVASSYENGALDDLMAGNYSFPSAFPWVIGKAQGDLERLGQEMGEKGQPIQLKIEEQYFQALDKSSRLAQVRLYYIYRLGGDNTQGREVMGISDLCLWRPDDRWKIYRID